MVQLLWKPLGDDPALFYVISAAWGVCNAVWEMMNFSKSQNTPKILKIIVNNCGYVSIVDKHLHGQLGSAICALHHISLPRHRNGVRIPWIRLHLVETLPNGGVIAMRSDPVRHFGA